MRYLAGLLLLSFFIVMQGMLIFELDKREKTINELISSQQIPVVDVPLLEQKLNHLIQAVDAMEGENTYMFNEIQELKVQIIKLRKGE